MKVLEKNPLVSIIIPVYNREKYIIDAIRSSCNQTYKNIEIIIVDNHSTDKTWNVLQEWAGRDSRIRIFQNEKNVGPVRNWECCLNKTKGDFLKILWSDDWMSETFVEEALKRMDDDTAFVISDIDVVNDNGESIFGYSFTKEEYSCSFYLNDILYFRCTDFPVSPGCALFRTKDVKESLITSVPNEDGLDSSQNGAGNDLLLFLRTANKYKNMKVIPQVLNYFRAHEGSFTMSSNIVLYYEWAKLYFVKDIIKDTSKLPIMKFWAGINGYKSLEDCLRNVPNTSYSYLKFIYLTGKSQYSIEDKCQLLDRNLDLKLVFGVSSMVMRSFARKLLSLTFGHKSN